MTTTYEIHAESVRALRLEGLSFSKIAAAVGLSKTQCRRIAARLAGTDAARTGTGIDQSIERIASKPQKKSSRPSADDIRERIATDELTVPFSNWLGNGWVRDSGEPQEVYETDESGEQVLVGMKVDPGVLWPDDWTGPKTVDDIYVHPNVPAPRRSRKRGFILTMAQALTPAHGPFVLNLHALAAALGDYEIVIGGATYGKNLFTEKRRRDLLEVAPWSSMIGNLVTRSRRHLADGVQACFEMNMRPTKSNPLTGLNGYIRGVTSIFAHPRRAIVSVPRPQFNEPVTMWTTGACTAPNYVTQEAGLKGLERHTIGAVIVEIDSEDRVFIRNVDADPETGNFHDLDLVVSSGSVYTLDDAIRISDGYVDRPFLGIPCTHRAGIHPPYARAMWGFGGNPEGDRPLIDLVRAKGQAFNDLFDGQAINHHEDKNPLALYRRHAEGKQYVEPEIDQAARFLSETARPFCKNYITYSNHDDFLQRWLQRPSTEVSVENSKLWHLANYEMRAAIDRGEKFDVFGWVLRRSNPSADFELVNADVALRVYGTFYNFHGDVGANGARGSTAGLAKLGVKISKAHDHGLAWADDCISMGNLIYRADYAKGPTSWVGAWHLGHSDGNRQVGLLVGDKYRA
ncbi:hypothetical protein [Rhizobium ruizarguesonis]|uniref:hypothetical protein n=1 Tax=Rhizobium ruizarguesonis TaxID=2081791 RepID=UPI00102FDA9C|nr:hypothetical protein [Rhizobium ruizarguesonis]TBA24716.1 hypothetical protein ELH61_02390 [Rhizobium ruizarguesonis]